jgi:hypothetical protein
MLVAQLTRGIAGETSVLLILTPAIGVFALKSAGAVNGFTIGSRNPESVSALPLTSAGQLEALPKNKYVT